MLTLILLELVWLPSVLHSFYISSLPRRNGVLTSCRLTPPLLETVDLPSLLTSVETFDGSDVVDPVVVSSVFWTSLKAKFVSLIVGQVLATLAFGMLASLAASQLLKLGEWASNSISENITVNGESPRSSLGGRRTSNMPPVKIDLSKLALCILIDTIGSSSELLPVVGEATDFVWAPIAGLLLRNLFYGSNVVLILEFVEEILPFTDFLPLATICWVLDTFYGESSLAKTLGLGSFRPLDDNEVNDVTEYKRELQGNSLPPVDKSRRRK